MKSDQRDRTRPFVAEHLKYAHREHPYAAIGCLICTAWNWARETRALDDQAIRDMLAELQPIVEVQKDE
jgi:hypothetical protein